MRHLFATFTLILALSPFALGQDAAYSTTWGVTTLTFPPNSDTYVSLLFPCEEAFRGNVLSVETAADRGFDSVEGIEANDVVLNFADNSFAANEFTPAGNEEGNSFYLLVATGPLDAEGQPTGSSEEGAWLHILANGSNYVIISESDVLNSLDDVNNLTTTFGEDNEKVLVKIIPYWTLEKLFPGGEGIAAISSGGEIGTKSEILFPSLPDVNDPEDSENVPGIDLGASERLVLFDSGSALTWITVSGGQFDDAGLPYGQSPLNPYSFIVVRNQTDDELSVSHYGPVNTSAVRIPVGTVAANKSQDNPVGYVIPVTIDIDLLGLESVVEATGTITEDFDEVLVYNTNGGIDRGVNVRLFRFAGDNGKWYETDGTPASDSDFSLAPGDAILIRKKAGDSASASEWVFLPQVIRSLGGR